MNQPKSIRAYGFLASLIAIPLGAQNLLVNPDFSAGNTGFSTDYIFVNSGQSTTPDTYGVRTNSQNFNTNYVAFGDHTTGTGNMMLLDGYPVANKTAWTQTVTTQTNKAYTFSGWATASDATNFPALRFSINGTQVGSDFALSTNAGAWQPFSVTWNSGTQTSATIAIKDTITLDFGNDFALDDLSFATAVLTNPVASIYLAAEIGWNSILNQPYQVQYSTELDTNNWQNLGSPVQGNGTTNYVFDSMRGQPKKFYRVQVLP